MHFGQVIIGDKTKINNLALNHLILTVDVYIYSVSKKVSFNLSYYKHCFNVSKYCTLAMLKIS